MKYLIIFLISLVLLLTQWHVYKQGLRDGELNYKNSRRIYFALRSAYHFGYSDCHEGKIESWDGN